MKVAVFTDTFLPQINGVTVHIDRMTRELAKKGHSFIVFAPKERGFGPRTPKGVVVEWVPSFPFPPYPEYRVCPHFPSRAKKAFEEFSPDIVHCHTPFSLGIAGAKLAKTHSVPLVGTYNTLLPEFLAYLPLPFLKKTEFAKTQAWRYTNWFYSKCSRVICPSKELEKELLSHGLKAKTTVIPYGIDFGLFSENRAKKARDFTVVFFGRMSFEKRIDVVVRAFKLALEKKPGAKLLLVGDGPARKDLESLVKGFGLGKSARFTGALRGKALAKKVSSAHVFATASSIETFGLSTAEAMAAGLPAIAADARANREVVKSGTNGFLFPEEDEFACAEKIVLLAGDKKLLKKLSSNAKKYAETQSVSQMAGRFSAMYRSVSFNA